MEGKETSFSIDFLNWKLSSVRCSGSVVRRGVTVKSLSVARLGTLAAP
jgi:hypothetical protein